MTYNDEPLLYLICVSASSSFVQRIRLWVTRRANRKRRRILKVHWFIVCTCVCSIMLDECVLFVFIHLVYEIM